MYSIEKAKARLKRFQRNLKSRQGSVHIPAETEDSDADDESRHRHSNDGDDADGHHCSSQRTQDSKRHHPMLHKLGVGGGTGGVELIERVSVVMGEAGENISDNTVFCSCKQICK